MDPSAYRNLCLDGLPHNGREEFQELVKMGQTKTYLGGQQLMIHLAMTHTVATFAVGRRVGKSTGIFFLWMAEQARTEGRYNAGYIAQDHAKAAEAFQNFIMAMGGDPKLNPGSLITRIHNSPAQDRWIEVGPLMEDGKDKGNTGGRYYFWSGSHPHYETIRGFMFPFHRIVVDEAKDIHQNCVTRVISPMLADSHGKLAVLGTPGLEGVGNGWFQIYFNKGTMPTLQMDGWVSRNFPSEANPFIPLDALKAARARCLSKNEETQEYDARFLSDTGGVFGNLDACFCLIPLSGTPHWVKEMQDKEPCPGLTYWIHKDPEWGHKYAMGVDWAKLQDQSVCSVWDLNTGEQAALFAFRGEDYEVQLAWIHTIKAKYRSATIHSDNNGVGVAMTERLARLYQTGIVPHGFTAHNKAEYVRRAQMLFNEAAWKFINCPEQREQFRIFTAEKTASGYVKYTHPDDEHDDFVDAAMMVGPSISWGMAGELSTQPTDPPFLSFDWYMRLCNDTRTTENARKVQI